MEKSTWLWILAGGGLAYWIYSKGKQNLAFNQAMAQSQMPGAVQPWERLAQEEAAKRAAAASTSTGPYSTMEDPTNPENYPQ